MNCVNDSGGAGVGGVGVGGVVGGGGSNKLRHETVVTIIGWQPFTTARR